MKRSMGQARASIDRMLGGGRILGEVENYIVELELTEDQKSALWLYADGYERSARRRGFGRSTVDLMEGAER